MINYIFNKNVIIIHLIFGLTKISLHKMSYFPELDLATKSNLKTETPVDTSKFPKEFDLADLIPNVEDLDIDKLKNCSFEIK